MTDIILSQGLDLTGSDVTITKSEVDAALTGYWYVPGGDAGSDTAYVLRKLTAQTIKYDCSTGDVSVVFTDDLSNEVELTASDTTYANLAATITAKKSDLDTDLTSQDSAMS